MNKDFLEQEISKLEAKLAKADAKNDVRMVAMIEDSLDHMFYELDKV